MDEPRGVPRVTVEQKNRAQRLKMLGNSIVPQIAMQIGLALKEDMISTFGLTKEEDK
jgi:hypothetical protein